MIDLVENIPNVDDISRLIEWPRTYDREQDIILQLAFEFPGGEGESVVWRKHKPDEMGVHELGQIWESFKRQRRPDMRYVGFVTANVGVVRGLRTARGHGFTVVHEPSEGRHHAQIELAPAAADGDGKLLKAEKTELRLLLRNVFGAVTPVKPDAGS